MSTNPFDRAVRHALASSQETVKRATRWHDQNARQYDQVLRVTQRSIDHATTWINRHREQIAAVVDSLQTLQRRADEYQAEWENAGLGYLVGPLGMAEHLVLSLHAAPGDAEELFDFLEAALADDEFVREASAALDGASVLSDIPRGHLKHGLRHLRDREPLHAWPPLIIGLEGAFVDVALDERLAVRVDNHVYLADENGNPLSTKAPSVEGVAKLLGHEAAGTDFGAFLIRQVYGGEGNPFRHGTARDGVRDRAICLAVAVVGWVDAFVAPGTRELLGDAVRRELERRDEESERRAREEGL